MAKENAVIGMYSATTGDAAATIDVPDDGLLLGCFLHVEGTLNADAEECEASVEFGSVNTRTTNDTRSLLAFVQAKMGLLTSGAGSNVGSQWFSYGDGIVVFGGERIYLHTAGAGSTLVNARALLVFSFAQFKARRR